MRIGKFGKLATGIDTPGERFETQWLDRLPKAQWPAYIDESARLVLDGIAIGDTELTISDFGFETGQLYRNGLCESTGVNITSTSLPIGERTGTTVGEIAFEFARLEEELAQSEHARYADFGRAVQAAVNKALVERIDDGLDTEVVEQLELTEGASTTDLMVELLCRPHSPEYIDALIETVEELTGSSETLLSILEAPRMTTSLWDHQTAALEAWFEHDCRGVLNMATATGKTVCGIAAIAHHFGDLHPTDRGLGTGNIQVDGRATVVVVAHRKLILEQWQREFDRHLNIPEERDATAERTATFDWGDVRFVTADHLVERGVPEADLVVLDETHHYLGSSGFGSLLDEFEGDLLALSGSLTEANRRSLNRREVPEVYEFTLRDGQEAGVVPTCSWTVRYTPFEGQGKLADVTKEVVRGMEEFADGERLAKYNDELEDRRAKTGFETVSEARSLSQSTLGRAAKEQDPAFRAFSSAIKSRQMTRYNLSPDLETVARTVLEHIREKKCVVLLESGDEVDAVADLLETALDDAADLITVLDTDADPLATVEQFDEQQQVGALLGIGKTLGEGVDIKTAEVAVNRGRGRMSRSLVQRMGRVLRNPTGDKHAEFYHVVGLPTQEEAIMPEKDGVEVLETAAKMIEWGKSLRAPPSFEVDASAGTVASAVETLEVAGALAVRDSSYEPPEDMSTAERLNELVDAIQAGTGGSVLLDLEVAEPEATVEPEIAFSLADGDPQFDPFPELTVIVECWVGELLVATLGEREQSLDALANTALRTSLDEEFRVPVRAAERTQLCLRLSPALARLVKSSGVEPASLGAGRLSEAVQSALLSELGFAGLNGEEVAATVERLFEDVTPRCYGSVGDVVNRAQRALAGSEVVDD